MKDLFMELLDKAVNGWEYESEYDHHMDTICFYCDTLQEGAGGHAEGCLHLEAVKYIEEHIF